jgi:hypothetical protein
MLSISANRINLGCHTGGPPTSVTPFPLELLIGLVPFNTSRR